jgi:ABC-type transport system involved in cytochrome c biogenesis permease subunit
MKSLLRTLRNFFNSLSLTVVLLTMSMVLVFAATLDQVHLGIWEVQEKYFRSFFVMWSPLGPGLSFPVFPGGYMVGTLLLANLICAHVYRFRLSWRKAGLQLVHAGLILMLLGELLTGLVRKDSSLRLSVGETKDYSESFRSFELAVIDRGNAGYDEVVAIPEAVLANKSTLKHPKLPFELSILEYYPNAVLKVRDGSGPPVEDDPNSGFGTRVALDPAAPGEVNSPGAYLRISASGKPLGTWLVSPLLPDRQSFTYDGHDWEIVLRPERFPLPASLTLLKVTNDLYPGTSIPKNFASLVRIQGGERKEDREVEIHMNSPLRMGGQTFYQYQMNAPGSLSVLEVVRNPGWRIPYAACVMMGVGLVIQFSISLAGYLKGRPAGVVASPSTQGEGRGLLRMIPLVALVLGMCYVGSPFLAKRGGDGFDLTALGRVPVLLNGRIKPLDSVARSTLLTLQGRQRVGNPEASEPLVASPDHWLADALFERSTADSYPTFRIDSPEVRMVLGLGEDQTRIRYQSGTKRLLALFGFLPAARARFSFAELSPHLGELERQARLADGVQRELRTTYQRNLLEVRDHVELYVRLKSSLEPPDAADFRVDLAQFAALLPEGIKAVKANQEGRPYDPGTLKGMKAMEERFGFMEQMGYLLPVPPDEGDGDRSHWRSAGTALLESFGSGRLNPSAVDFAVIGHAWRAGDAVLFNSTLQSMNRRLDQRYPSLMNRVGIELQFNRMEPFYTSMVLYGAAFLLAVLSWLRWPKALGVAAFWLVAIAWVLASAGIATRMWLEGRPPVTNLYSSALFVGWGAVAFCIVLERMNRNAVGSAAAGMIGFATLLIAHHLSLAGDTLEMMRAVLDSNFWLATHVVVVTLGYASTFLAGFLATVYICRGLFTRSLDAATADSLERMVYGIVCFATLFSLVGTILGGIWADQSWGRFWGWDPKENGALLIVVWNAVILHARLGGLIRARGLMVMAVFGNIVTSWSWFGVNMLGVGLHSYGFMESAFYWLIAFVGSQLLLMCLALRPIERWRSFAPRARPAG